MNTFSWLLYSAQIAAASSSTEQQNHQQQPEADSEFNYSLILPITVGLGSVVASLVLGARNGLFTGTSMPSGSNSLKVNPNSESVSGKRKNRQHNDHHKSVMRRPSQTSSVTATDQPGSSSASLSSKLASNHTTQVKISNGHVNSSLPSYPDIDSMPSDQQVSQKQLNDPTLPKNSTTPLPDALSDALPMKKKSSKKSKRSSKSSTQKQEQHDAQHATSTSLLKSDNLNATVNWVVVTSKKAKRPSATDSMPSSVLADSIITKTNSNSTSSNNKQASAPFAESTDKDSLLLNNQVKRDKQFRRESSSHDSVPSSAASFVDEPIRLAVTANQATNRPTSPVVNTLTKEDTIAPSTPKQKKNKKKKENQQSTPQTIIHQSVTEQTASPSQQHNSPVERITAAYEDLLRRSLGDDAILTIHRLLGVGTDIISPPPSSPHPVATPVQTVSSPKPPIASQPAAAAAMTNEAKTHQHLPSLIQAKEAECDLLRSEVVNLRKQTTQLLQKQHQQQQPQFAPTPSTTPQPTVSPVPSTTSSEAITEGFELVEPTHTHSLVVVELQAATSQANKSEKKQDSTATAAAPSDDADAVILKSLQSEIATLCKELTLSRQRYEHLQAQHETSCKQVDRLKSEVARAAQPLRAELEEQRERARLAGESAAQMRTELQDALQKIEVQRRKYEDSEKNLRDARSERDLLQKEHVHAMTQLTTANQSKVDELNVQLKQLQTELINAQSERERAFRSDSDAQHHLADLRKQLSSVTENERESQSKLDDLSKHSQSLQSRLDSCEQELETLRSKSTDLERELVQARQIAEVQSVVSTADSEGTVSQPTTGLLESQSFLESFTQTDLDMCDEFDSVVVSRAEEDAAVKPDVVTAGDKAELEAQVVHYKSALDLTENMLSDLQRSVNEEEARWRKALDTSRSECELLEAKVTRLESSLANMIGERTALTKSIEEFRRERMSVCEQVPMDSSGSFDGRSSNHSLSVSRVADSYTVNEDTPRTDLVRNLNTLRYLVQVEHEALKHEQAHSARLQNQLNETATQQSCGVLITSSLNGSCTGDDENRSNLEMKQHIDLDVENNNPHGPPDTVADSHSAPDGSRPDLNGDSCGQTNVAIINGNDG